MGCQDQVAIWAVGRLAWLGVEGLRGCCATVAAWSAHWPISVYIVMYIDILLPHSSLTALRWCCGNSELGLLDRECGGAEEGQDREQSEDSLGWPLRPECADLATDEVAEGSCGVPEAGDCAEESLGSAAEEEGQTERRNE